MIIWLSLAWAGPAEEIPREPEDGEAWYELAFELLEGRELLSAADAFARAAELGTDVALSRYNEACALALAGESQRALAAFEAAIAAGYANARWASSDPDLSAIAGDPRFERALQPLVLVDLLARITGRDGVGITKQAARAQLAPLCEAEEAVPCALATIDLSDRAGLEAALAPLCGEGSAVACLGAAWASLPPSLAGTAPLDKADATFVSRVSAACDARIARGCTELGFAYAAGRVSYPNLSVARQLWRDACDIGEDRACTVLAGDDPARLSKQAAKGEPVAAIAVADDATDYERLCLGGVMIGCVNLATSEGALSDEALAIVRASCADGDVTACAFAVRIDAVRGSISPQRAAEVLDRACPLFEGACEEAAFLSQGAPPVVGYPQPIVNPKDIDRALFNASKPLHRCLLDALDRDPSAGGLVRVALRLSERGTVDGVYIRDPIDEEYHACAISALRGAQIRTRGVPSRVAFSISANHGTTFVIDSNNPDAGGDVAKIAADSQSWAAPFDTCALKAGVVIADEILVLSLFAGRDGQLSQVEIVEGIEEPEVEACVVDFLSSHLVKDPVVLGTKLRVEARLLQMREAAEVLPAEDIRLLPDEPGPPVEIDLLALVASRSLVDGHRARMYRGPVASIQEAHEEMAEAIEEMTGGKLVVHTEVRLVDTTLDMGALEEDEKGLQRYNIQAEDLPPALLAAIQQGRWESIFVWGAIPTKFPQPALGVTYGGLLVGGATFSSGVLPAGTRLTSNDNLPPYELPLHEWWHQVEQRAEGYLGLGVGWPPQNHAPLSVGGRVLDPRSWMDLSEDTTIAWYRHVLGSMPRAFWADVWSGGVRRPTREDNLAARATPLGDNVRHLLGLNDTVLDFGGYPMPTEAPSAKTPPAFGLAWGAAISVRRVVLYTGGWDEPERSSWRKARLEIQPAGTPPGTWQPVEVEPAVDGATWTFTMPPIALSALRVVVTEGEGQVLCREIEVYAD